MSANKLEKSPPKRNTKGSGLPVHMWTQPEKEGGPRTQTAKRRTAGLARGELDYGQSESKSHMHVK